MQNLKNIFFLCCHNDKELPTVEKTSDLTLLAHSCLAARTTQTFVISVRFLCNKM